MSIDIGIFELTMLVGAFVGFISFFLCAYSNRAILTLISLICIGVAIVLGLASAIMWGSFGNTTETTEKTLVRTMTPFREELGIFTYQNKENEEKLVLLPTGTKVVYDSQSPYLEQFKITTTETRKWLIFRRTSSGYQTEYVLHLAPTN